MWNTYNRRLTTVKAVRLTENNAEALRNHRVIGQDRDSYFVEMPSGDRTFLVDEVKDAK